MRCPSCKKTDDKVIVFGRGDLFFFFNFHPSRSFVDYGVEVPPGEYTLELASRFREPLCNHPDQWYQFVPLSRLYSSAPA